MPTNHQTLTAWDYLTMPFYELIRHLDYDPARAVRIDDALDDAISTMKG